MSSLTQRLNIWFKKYQSYFFSDQEGFYNLSYLANSPISMFESYKKMPFHKFNEKTQLITANTPFTKGELQYAFLEEGLILVRTKMLFKANVSFTQIIDEKLPNDYYFLSYNISKNEKAKEYAHVNSFDFSNKNWTLKKPNYSSKVSYLKNSDTENLIIYFSEDWFKNYILNDKAFYKSSIKHFFDSDQGFIIWPDNSIDLFDMAINIKQFFLEEGVENKLQLKLKTLELISGFIRLYDSENLFKNYKDLNPKDIILMNKVELFLTENIYAKFMGMASICNKFKISETKLKLDFKAMYGISVFKYFQNKQMKLAASLLKRESYRVKELAALFGYENTGKFSNTFKKINGILPSEVNILE